MQCFLRHGTAPVTVAAARGHALHDIFGRSGVVIGVVHCAPLPGAPDYDGAPVAGVLARALDDARAYADAGFDGLIVENHGDVPFLKPEQIGPETSALLAVIADRVREAAGIPIGINVLANATLHALAVAKASGAAFVRANQFANAYVANEGLIEGSAPAALRYRAMLHARDVRIFADAHVKHGAHAIVGDRSVAEQVRDVEFFHADAVIATGQRTGDAATEDEIATFRGATALPLLIGSGVTEANIETILRHADGVIVASAIKHDGVWWNPVDPARAQRFMQRVQALRGPMVHRK
ncbi:MAG: BtpA/SgcQ family protein [Alphaproteobacteria bacterium]|nr:BtpA/SgcQ family protein [Alphaproteobacteria bacterium]